METNPMPRNRPLIVLTALFLVRLVVNFVHGHAHDELAVPLAPWQNAFVWATIIVGPVVAIIWLWVRPSVAVAWSLAAMLAAGWLFGLYFHFGPVNPDHVSMQPHTSGRQLFIGTAAALAVVEPLTVLAAVWLARSLNRAGGPKYA